MTAEPLDIIMLTHNRLEHLVMTVEALEARTPEPYRLTVVDNASGPELRNWLADNRRRFANIIYRPTNEHVPGFNHGIAATTSDPFVVTDPDVVVPELEPSWLSRMRQIVDRHPDFGLVGMGLDQSNRPPVLDREVIDPAQVVDGEIVETGIGTTFQFIRRDALVTQYRSDGQACTTVRRAGYRVGWTPGIRGFHLGWDDYRLYPGHLLSKTMDYGIYREVGMVPAPPTLEQLARAAPAVRETRRRGIPDAAVLELSWSGPVVAAALPEAVGVAGHTSLKLPLEDGAAGAVVIVDPPAEHADALVAEACRVATAVVVAIGPLERFGARPAAALAPAGWGGSEVPGTGEIVLALARDGDGDAALEGRLTSSLAGDRERWLDLFGRGGIGASAERIWVWERPRAPSPTAVRHDAGALVRWTPPPLATATAASPGLLKRAWRRADIADRADVLIGRARRRVRR